MIIRTVENKSTFTFDSYKHCKRSEDEKPFLFFLFTNTIMLFFAICPIVNIFVLRDILTKNE